MGERKEGGDSPCEAEAADLCGSGTAWLRRVLEEK